MWLVCGCLYFWHLSCETHQTLCGDWRFAWIFSSTACIWVSFAELEVAQSIGFLLHQVWCCRSCRFVTYRMPSPGSIIKRKLGSNCSSTSQTNKGWELYHQRKVIRGLGAQVLKMDLLILHESCLTQTREVSKKFAPSQKG